MKPIFALLVILSILSCKKTEEQSTQEEKPQKLKALIIDGQNNHGVWPKTTMMMQSYLEETGLFQVDIYRSKYTYQGPHHGIVDGFDHDTIVELLTIYKIDDRRVHVATETITPDPSFKPEFSRYDVVVSNFGWESSDWIPEVKEDFENYMKNGGGLVVVHAANNAWGDWDAFNKMIGVGGWGDRAHEDQNHLFYNGKNELIKQASNGEESSHGPEMEYILTTHEPEHPIMKGLPKKWRHTKDELYDRLRGPAENMTVLATAFSDVEENAQPWALENKGSGRHEPLLMVIDYGKGRIFHTALGHMDYSMEGVGFITTLQRGAEWAATGTVTQKVPRDFPNVGEATNRSWNN